MSDTKLIRQTESNALLNNDYKALEDYKLKKKQLRDINSLKEEVNVLKAENISLQERVAKIEMLLNK